MRKLIKTWETAVDEFQIDFKQELMMVMVTSGEEK